MPSIGTSILSARVKDETIKMFKETAEVFDTTVPQILDALAGVTPDHSGALNAFVLDTPEKELHRYACDLVDELIDAGYPESEIRTRLSEGICYEQPDK